jgi:transposase
MPRLDPRRLVFLDETWAKTNMARLRGRAPVGERLMEAVPHGHWKTTTVLMGLRACGPVAPLVIDGAVNGSMFRAWVEQHLTRELRKGDLVVMDNLSAHKVKGVDEAIRGRGASVRYLPPYSPDFNPIENAFSKLKHLLRSAAERTVDALWSTVGRVLDYFPAGECLNYIRHAGYGVRTQHATSR